MINFLMSQMLTISEVLQQHVFLQSCFYISLTQHFPLSHSLSQRNIWKILLLFLSKKYPFKFIVLHKVLRVSRRSSDSEHVQQVAQIGIFVVSIIIKIRYSTQKKIVILFFWVNESENLCKSYRKFVNDDNSETKTKKLL